VAFISNYQFEIAPEEGDNYIFVCFLKRKTKKQKKKPNTYIEGNISTWWILNHVGCSFQPFIVVDIEMG
jgi:hypothetical protein